MMTDDLGPHARSDEILGRFYCVHCGNDWPCRVAVLASRVASLRQIAELAEWLISDSVVATHPAVQPLRQALDLLPQELPGE